MNSLINLKKLEKKAFKSFNSDGLYDIVLGLFLLIGALSSTLSNLGVPDTLRITIYVPLMLACPLLLIFGKRKITVPRIGFVRFSEKRKNRLKKLNLIIITAVILTGIFLLIISRHYQGQSLKLATIPLNAVLVFIFMLCVYTAMAYLLDYRRLYFYAFLIALTEPVYVFLEQSSQTRLKGLIAYGIPAVIILTIGIHTLIRFIHKYRITEKEVSS